MTRKRGPTSAVQTSPQPSRACEGCARRGRRARARLRSQHDGEWVCTICEKVRDVLAELEGEQREDVQVACAVAGLVASVLDDSPAEASPVRIRDAIKNAADDWRAGLH